MTDTTKQAEPVARKTIQSMVRAAFHFGAKHNHFSSNVAWLSKEHKNLDEYGLLIDKAINMDAQDETVIGEKSAVALALTAELKTELLEALRIGEKAKLEQLNLIPASGPKSHEIFALKYSIDQIRAAITKLTNLECGS